MELISYALIGVCLTFILWVILSARKEANRMNQKK